MRPGRPRRIYSPARGYAIIEANPWTDLYPEPARPLMARIGQLLVRANLVSENNLARALGVQHFAGGRLGTLLLERGSVSEDDLGGTLAEQHGCEYAPWRVLGEVPPATIAALPAKFAIKHSAIPFERGEGYLKIALRDPSDLRILDELFFVTGRKILPAVAPEVRLYQALEKYYGERRTPRFAILAEKLSRPMRSPRGGGPSMPPPPVFFPDPPRREPAIPPPVEVWGEPADPELTASPIIHEWKLPDSRPAGWGGFTPAGPPAPVEVEAPETISWEEMSPSLWIPASDAEALAGTVASPGAAEPSAQPAAAEESKAAIEAAGPAAATPRPVEQPAGVAPVLPTAPMPASAHPAATPQPGPSAPAVEAVPRPIESAAAGSSPRARAPVRRPRLQGLPTPADFPDVAEAKDRDGIAAAALVAVARRFARVAVFVCKPASVCGWGASGDGVDVAELLKADIPWNEPSVFLNVRLSRAFYLGPLPPLPRHDPIIRAFGGSADECLVQPVFIKDKVVAFLYAEFPDAGASPLDLAYMRELAAAASAAFVNAIRLKKKEI